MKTIASIVLILFVLQGCALTADEDTRRPQTLPRALTADEEALISSSNSFSLDMLQQVAAGETGNVCISPLSISMALNGAEGDTKTGIQQTLGMSGMPQQAINTSYRSLIELLTGLDPRVAVTIANALWTDADFSVRSAFSDTLETYFHARSDALDFSDPAAANTINQWVREQTNGRVDDIIGSIDPETVLYFVNAVYVKGKWFRPFDAEQTQTEDFYLSDGSTTQVEMMSQDEGPVAVHRSDAVEMAALAYGDSLYQMMIMMPPEGSGSSVDAFVDEALTESNLTAWTGQLRSEDVQVKLPKFESSYEKELGGILSDMGMHDAFSEQRANFSKISPNVPLSISDVKHKATITVNEEGSEAAAGTSVGVHVTSGPASFIVNRPFVYLIRERISGTILFAGVMKNPANS